VGRKCLCNALHANIGLGQIRPSGKTELPLITAGAELGQVVRFLDGDRTSYTAADVIEYILGRGEQVAGEEEAERGGCPTIAGATA